MCLNLLKVSSKHMHVLCYIMNLSARLEFSIFLNVPLESTSNPNSLTEVHNRQRFRDKFCFFSHCQHVEMTLIMNYIRGLSGGFSVHCKVALENTATANSFSSSQFKTTIPGARQKCRGAGGDATLQKCIACSTWPSFTRSLGPPEV